MAGKEHMDLLNNVYCQFSHTNPMHTDIFPSVRQMESEVIAMTAAFLGGQFLLPFYHSKNASMCYSRTSNQNPPSPDFQALELISI